MARAFVSPAGDPTWANATASLAEVFDPARKARIKQAGATYQNTLANTQKTELGNQALEDENAAWDAGPDAAGMTPEQFATARLGRAKATPQGLAQMMAQYAITAFRQAARDKAVAGDQQGATNELFGVASGPVPLQSVDNGYVHNRYNEASPLSPTGKTLAEIVTQGAAANAHNASADSARARAAKTRDEMANPGRYHTSSGKPAKVSPDDVAGLGKLIGNYIPAGAGADPAALNQTLTRAAELYQQSGDSQSSVEQAITEVFGSNAPKATEGTRAPGIMDGPWDWLRGNPQPDGKPMIHAAKPGGAAKPAASPPQMRKTLHGKNYVKINGQWFEE